MTSTAYEHGIHVRPATAADAEAVLLITDAGFGVSSEPENQYEFSVFPLEQALVAVDGERVVGYSAVRPQTITVPEGRSVLAETIANVAVAPTHRRRGILRALYTEQHRRTEAAKRPITAFTASQGGIYGRFGYAPAVVTHDIVVQRAQAEFRADAPDPGGVELTPIPVARQVIPEIYQRWQRVTPGAQQRPGVSWAMLFDDPVHRRGGGTRLFALVHADGYALYRYHRRATGSAVEVVELRAVTPVAYAGLWRALLALELFDRVEASVVPGDPLPYLLTDPRQVYTVAHRDALWLRLMDVPAALTARGYAGDLDLVLAVHDPFRDAGGAFALRVCEGVAECAPTERAADAELGIDVLAGMYLGAHRARAFAAANRLRTGDPALLRALDTAFGSEREAALGWFF
ncbi:GNAT family N-acetyltransferase [Nocardia sp. alder85J]|uniref:GNAT family N-acetyltransferase n=1 Tax=Nocardia sp. alder85J TaxID=2862949 RepID=UPI001CD71CC3|nr:GNAT family N-acetyltransferase [Nocardia sp. alder85J]MCX4093309.1 GNAT family N-acetyltransferase [Nocardia sp. alder85J]